MITKKVIKVPIYDDKVIIVVADNLNEARELYPTIGENIKACVLEGSGYSIIVVPPNQLNLVIHECLHLKNCIWNHIGYKPISNNDEVDAYLIEYLFDQVLKTINKHNLVIQC